MVKTVHSIEFKVFVKLEDDIEKLKTTLLNLIPFPIELFEKEKIKLNEEVVKIVDGRSMKILSVILTKQRHTSKFLDFFKSKLSKEIIDTLILQLDSRMDEDLNFFIRLDKKHLIHDKFELTDSGDCFHLKFLIASYPAKLDSAKQIVKSYLTA